MSALEFRDRGGKLEMEGHASVFSHFYPIGPGIEEQIVPGAFRRSLDGKPAVALRVEHSALPLAHTRGQETLKLSEDSIGLLAVAELNPRDPDVQNVRAKSENSPLEMSFAFRCNRDRHNEDYTKRWIDEAVLNYGDVSIVCFGANDRTDVSIMERTGGITLEDRKAFVERVSGWVGGPRHEWAVRSSKYTDAEIQAMGAKGEAYKNSDGHYSYPIADAQDLSDAVRAIGRSNAEHQKVRVYVMKRAKELHLGKMIPSTWQADGSLSGRSLHVVDIDKELREISALRTRKPGWGSRATVENDSLESCGLCSGSGTIREGNRLCPDCKGVGKIAKKVKPKGRSKDYNAIQRREEAELAELVARR